MLDQLWGSLFPFAQSSSEISKDTPAGMTEHAEFNLDADGDIAALTTRYTITES